MVLYVDTSALLKRYIDEHDSDVADALMAADPVLVTSRITEVEARRNLARLLGDDAASSAKRQFLEDFDAFALVAVDATTCNDAARIAERTLCRSLDALHIAAAIRSGPSTRFLTFDVRQAEAARMVGLDVVGT